MSAINLTFEFTAEFAAESVAAAGGRGSRDEIEMAITHSRIKHRVLQNNIANFIEGQAQHGYRVVDAEVSKPPEFCREPARCAGLGSCPREIACNA